LIQFYTVCKTRISTLDRADYITPVSLHWVK